MSSLMDTYARQDITFVKGKGARLIDTRGDEYIDFGSGISVTNLGHAHPLVTEAIKSQAEMLTHTSNLYTIKLQEDFADIISKNSFGGKVFFCNSGAEANECALKLARIYGNEKYHGKRYKVISIHNSFHGRTLATLAATAQAKVQKGFAPNFTNNIYVPFNDFEAIKLATDLDDVVAIILEVYQGEGGVVVADEAYLKAVRQYCTEKDILLIFDEVQSGFGRTGKLFGYQNFNIEPDIMTLAKAIANGLPMGATVAVDKVSQYFKPGTHGSTFGGTPLVCAAGIATVNVMLAPNFLSDVLKKSERVRNALSAQLKDIKLKGKGLMLGVETKYSPSDVVNACIKNKLLVIPAGNNTVRVYPPLNISDEELDMGVKRFVEAINGLGK